MGNPDENDIRIADYLEHKMSQEEEESFMHELSVDTHLQKQFEEALLVGSMLNTEEVGRGSSENLFFHSADDHIRMMQEVLGDTRHQKQIEQNPNPFLSYGKIAAAFIILLAVSAVCFFIIKGIDKKEMVGKAPSGTNKSVKDSVNNIAYPPTLQNSTVGTDSIFKQFYQSYTAKQDPVEIGGYYKDYREHKFGSVIYAKDGDYLLMGTSDRPRLLKQYMFLYKGLSLLEENKPIEAILQFDSASMGPQKNGNAFHAAQWYKTLAFLKANNVNGALESIKSLSTTSSPYRRKALSLENAIRLK